MKPEKPRKQILLVSTICTQLNMEFVSYPEFGSILSFYNNCVDENLLGRKTSNYIEVH